MEAVTSMKFLYVILILFAGAANAHLSGFTDSTIQIAQPGIKVIYTTPADNLLELDPLTKGKDKATIQHSEYYLKWVIAGWQIHSGKRNCFVTKSQSLSLDEINAYQYVLEYSCPQGLNELTIQYKLFTEQWRGHQNFTRVFLAGQQQRMRFAFDRSALEISVPKLLSQWQLSLDEGFLQGDPNRGMNKAQMGLGTDGGMVSDISQSVSSADPRFVLMGMTHIWEGLDHMLFIVALLLIPVTWKRLLLWISLFTLAHSITLSLAYYGIFRLSPQVTEPLVALTVLAIGVENLRLLMQKAPSFRWRPLMIFLFGLIHGIGLSYQLGEASGGIPSVGRLLYFNLGVELGQLVAVALLAPMLWGLRNTKPHWPVATSLSVLLSVFGGFWFIERALLS